MYDISYSNVFRIFIRLLFLSDGYIYLSDKKLYSFLIQLFFEHFLENSEDYFELLFLIFWDLHADPVENAVTLFFNVIDQLFELGVRFIRCLICGHYLAIDLGVVSEILDVSEDVYLETLLGLKIFQSKIGVFTTMLEGGAGLEHFFGFLWHFFHHFS